MLIAEQLALLTLSPDGAINLRFAGYLAKLDYGFAAALLTELAVTGKVVPEGRSWKVLPAGERLRVVDRTTPEQRVLAEALGVVMRRGARKIRVLMEEIASDISSQVVLNLIARGLIGDDGPPGRRYPVHAAAEHAAILERVRRAAAIDGELDLATAMLLALSRPCGLLKVVAPERGTRRAAKRRIRTAIERVAVASDASAAALAAAVTVAAATVRVVKASGSASPE